MSEYYFRLLIGEWKKFHNVQLAAGLESGLLTAFHAAEEEAGGKLRRIFAPPERDLVTGD